MKSAAVDFFWEGGAHVYTRLINSADQTCGFSIPFEII
jgi:hypothetical protein